MNFTPCCNVIVNLILALCSDSEFSCGNGTCVPLSQECSGSAECPYSSDEIGCGKLENIVSLIEYKQRLELGTDRK